MIPRPSKRIEFELRSKLVSGISVPQEPPSDIGVYAPWIFNPAST